MGISGMNYYEKAEAFLKDVGLDDPTPDAIRQLTQAFLPALQIMCERNYGEAWKDGGWRGLVYEMRKKMDRVWHRSWLGSLFDADSGLDMINYAGFYYRMRCQGRPWGTKGEPDTVVISEVGMGHYQQVTLETGEQE